MTLTLLMHPLASFCHKVLIALYENGTPFEPRIVDFADPASSAELLGAWPVGKIPVLATRRRGATVPETSIIIEYLDRHHPGRRRSLPEDRTRRGSRRGCGTGSSTTTCSVPMQKIVADRLRPEGRGDPLRRRARRGPRCDTAYARGRGTARRADVGGGRALQPRRLRRGAGAVLRRDRRAVRPGKQALGGYFERLLARPSVARTLREARPYFSMFPYREAMPARFLEG